MKSSKKLLVALLVFTMLLSTVSIGFAAEAEKLAPEVVRAQALGILKGDHTGNLNLDKPITRAEALALIVRISGLESSADLMKGMTQFPDVTDAHWASGYVNLGVGQNIVNGYPDGTFKPEGNVTYAEMVKMLLYAMNYGVTVEGAAWPAGVMGKADQLDLFDKVNAAPNVPALRGDVVKMIDNSLTVKHLVQTGYGDLKQYEEGKDTFLSKLKVDELEDVVVTEIAKVNSKLDDDEIKLEGKDVDGIYTLKTDVSAEEIFGLKVNAWVNDDDEVFFVKVKTADKDVLLDSVKSNSEKEVELKVADKKYKWAKDAEVYVNFSEVDIDEVPDGAYGKVVLDRGEVRFANFFEFDEIGVVTEVKDKVIKYVSSEARKSDIDLEDADEVYIYNADFAAADLKDIDEDSAIFFWEADDEYHIIVKNEIVSGTLEKSKSDSVTVDGKTYKKAAAAVVTTNEGKDYSAWKDIEEIKDLNDEKVAVVLDLDGRALLITSSVKSTTDKLYGVVTYAKEGRSTEVSVFNAEGKEVDYRTKDRADLVELDGLKYFGKYKKGTGLQYGVLEYKLNVDSEITSPKAVVVTNDAITKGSAARVYDLEKEDDSKVVTYGTTGKFYVTKDTIIMRAVDSDDGELDPEVITYDKFVAAKITGNGKAVVFGEEGRDADFIVFIEQEFEISSVKDYYGVVTGKISKFGKDYYVEIDVFGEGKKEYKVEDQDDYKDLKGKLVKFNINSNGKLKEPVLTTLNGTYTDKDIYDVTNKVYYRIDKDAVIYTLDKDGDLDKKIGESRIDKDQAVEFVVDKDEYAVGVIVKHKGSTPTPGTTTLEKINAAKTSPEMLKELKALGYATFDFLTDIQKSKVASELASKVNAGPFADMPAVYRAIDAAIVKY